MEKFILCDDEKILYAGVFNKTEEIIDKCEGEYGFGVVSHIKKEIIKRYGEINKESIRKYYFDGDLNIYYISDEMFK